MQKYMQNMGWSKKSPTDNNCNTGSLFIDTFMNKQITTTISGERLIKLAYKAANIIAIEISNDVDYRIALLVDEYSGNSLRSFTKPVERERMLSHISNSEVYENLHDAIRLLLSCYCIDDNERKSIINLVRITSHKINSVKEYDDLSILAFMYLLALHTRVMLTDNAELKNK